MFNLSDESNETNTVDSFEKRKAEISLDIFLSQQTNIKKPSIGDTLTIVKPAKR